MQFSFSCVMRFNICDEHTNRDVDYSLLSITPVNTFYMLVNLDGDMCKNYI